VLCRRRAFYENIAQSLRANKKTKNQHSTYPGLAGSARWRKSCRTLCCQTGLLL
jgi:hypothetical protein